MPLHLSGQGLGVRKAALAGWTMEGEMSKSCTCQNLEHPPYCNEGLWLKESRHGERHGRQTKGFAINKSLSETSLALCDHLHSLLSFGLQA